MSDIRDQVLSWSGSDSSYDLIVQVVTPRPTEGVDFDVLGMDETPRLQALKDQARAFAAELLTDKPMGFRCIVAQRVPETFVWQARMRAALDKAVNPALGYGAAKSAATG